VVVVVFVVARERRKAAMRGRVGVEGGREGRNEGTPNLLI
jgi:hypothetical protein